MKHKLNKSPEQVLESIKESVTYARNLLMMLNGLVKMEHELTWIICVKSVELAIKCGAKTINIPDTVGYTVPSEFTKIIQH